MNIGFVTTRLFTSPRSGGELCTARLLQALAGVGHHVHVIGRGAPGPGQTTVGPLVPAFDTLAQRQRLGALLRAFAAGQASTVQRLAADGAPQRVQDWLARGGGPALDAVWVDHLQAWPWVAGALAARRIPLLLLMHNLESDGYAEQAAGGVRGLVLRREARLLRRLEQQALRAATVVACLSDADAACLRQRAADCGAAPLVEVLPGFPTLAPTTTRPPHDGPLRHVGLLGSWTWAPNRNGLRWMLDAVLPRLPGHCRLVLAGAGLDDWPLPARVRSLGRVDHVSRFYDAVDVVAVPSLQGSGVQEKAIEAIASGRTVVATRHAVRGLGPGLPQQVRVADDAEHFALACAAPLHASAALDPHSSVQWAAARRRAYGAALDRCLRAAA